MTNPSSNLRATEVIAKALGEDWPKFRTFIHQRKQPPTSSSGDGRSTDISDPTGNAVAHIATWEQYETDAGELTRKILLDIKALQTMVFKAIHVDLTKDEKAKLRCSGRFDPTCTELASVGPSGRTDRDGQCIRCYTAERRARQPVLRGIPCAATQTLLEPVAYDTRPVDPSAAAVVWCHTCRVDYAVYDTDPVAWLEDHRASCG